MSTFTGTVEEREHREFSPSKSERFFLCAGSANLIRTLPARERTKYAEDGDIAHTVLEAGLKTYATNATQAIAASKYRDVQFDNHWKGAINTALDYIWGVYELINAAYDDVEIYIENFVNPPINSAPGEAAGYCDIAIFSRRARWLGVIDYKHGEGIAKAAVGNTQVKQYGAGFLFDERSPIKPQDVDRVTLTIIQPRAFHPEGEIRETNTTPAELWNYLQVLDKQIAYCLTPTAPLTPGVDQCRFCEARSSCPALAAQVLGGINPNWKRIEDVTKGTLPDLKQLNVQQLAYAKNAFELLRIYMNGVDTHVQELLHAGHHVPGWKLVEADAQREFYEMDKPERVKALAALAGVKESELYSTKMKGIIEIENMIVDSFKSRVSRSRRQQAAADAKRAYAYFTLKQSSGKLTVAREDDPKPAVNKAERMFAGVNVQPPINQQGEPV